MPNRILKESVCSSENIDQLSAFQETFFYRLIVNCDDYGRMDARPKILAAKLFPLKDLRVSQIEDALRALTSAELITLYEVGGKPFLQMNTWDRHQQKRAKMSKYPGMDEDVISSDIICNQMISNVPVFEKRETRNEKRETRNENTPQAARERVDYAAVVELFNSICHSLPAVRSLSDARKKAVAARLSEINGSMDELRAIFEAVEASDFLSGRSKAWQASFDWIFKAANFEKIREGNYENRDSVTKYAADTGRYKPTYDIGEIENMLDAEWEGDSEC